MPRKSKAQRARYQNINFARENRVIIQNLNEPPNIDASDIEMTGHPLREEPVCGSEDPEMRGDEFENFGEGILGGVEHWEWSKDNSDIDSDSEYDPEDSPESKTESEVGVEDFDEEKNLQKEAELLVFSEALRQAQANAVALEKARTTKRHRGKSTGKSLSTIHRIARVKIALARSGQKSISSFFTGKKQRVTDNSESDKDLKMSNLTPETAEADAESDDEITEVSHVSTFSEHGFKAYCMYFRTTQQDWNQGKIWRR